MGELIGVTIKEYAQVATSSVIMPGVVIGVNALVGAQALVKKDVADERVVVGVPAKDVCSIRELKNNRGELIYPWKEHLKDFRGYPWQIKK
jgi:acetyltransferase-like isoleucine patch superfamily enzyme